MTIQQLKTAAATANIPGRSKMNKQQLCDAMGI